MSLAVRLILIYVALVFTFELLLYALRHYETVGSGERPGLRRGALNVLGSLLAQCTTTAALHLAAPLSLWWPFPSRPRAGRAPVVCVHGYGGSPAHFLVLAWRLRRDGFPNVAAVGYRSLGGDVHAAARKLAAAVDRVCAETGADRVDLVAHSLGGLVARAYVREHGGAQRVRRLVTLGSPHQGSKAAALTLDRLGRSMLPGSRLLLDLAREDPVPAILPVTSIFSPFDSKVLPWHNARYPGAGNVEIDGVGHDVLLVSPKVYTLIREALD